MMRSPEERIAWHKADNKAKEKERKEKAKKKKEIKNVKKK